MQEVVVGIDFGTSGTGYAYSYNNPEDIILGKFPDQGVDVKVPTEIILDSNLNILAFGHNCIKYIKDNQLVKGELYFQSIKMNIYDRKNNICPNNSSKNYLLVDIISKILEYIKQEAIKSIHFNRPFIEENHIKWVVTVPAIWNLSQKGIMIKACEKAGLFNQNTNISNFLSLEPEAASLYSSRDKSIDSNFLEHGKSYIICDLGGGTGDIVAHKKNLDGQISEIYQPIGGNFGSEEIEKEIFNKVIYKIFGFKDYIDLKKLNNEIDDPWKEDELFIEYLNLKEEISTKKKITEDLKDKSFSLNFQFLQDFINSISIDKLVEKYNNSCPEGWQVSIKNNSRWILTFPYKIIFDLIKDHANKISEKISEIYENSEDIESILFVGGYCSNEILINRISKEFRELTILKPSRPEIAVIKGAVLFGINPNIIVNRKAKYTIGFNCDDNWDEEIHGKVGVKYYDKDYNIYKCLDSFHIFVRIGESININDIITHYFTMQNSRFLTLKFFKTLKKDPVLFTEEGVELLGFDVTDLGRDYPIGERDIAVTLKFGGTYVEAKCIHFKSGIERNLLLYFSLTNE